MPPIHVCGDFEHGYQFFLCDRLSDRAIVLTVGLDSS